MSGFLSGERVRAILTLSAYPQPYVLHPGCLDVCPAALVEPRGIALFVSNVLVLDTAVLQQEPDDPTRVSLRFVAQAYAEV